METIKRKIHIAEDHHLMVEMTFPDRVPVGSPELTVVIAPLSRASSVQELLPYAGCLAQSSLADRGGLTIQRELRDEWN